MTLLYIIFHGGLALDPDTAMSIVGICNLILQIYFRQQEWLHCCGRSLALMKYTPQQLAKLVVCPNHFADCQYMGPDWSNCLLPNQLPSIILHVPGDFMDL